MSDQRPAGERLRRLLAILAYLARVGQAPLAELAARFEVSEETLVAELELAACCGLPPYTPDQLLELVVDKDSVRAFGLEALGRPRRLTPEEGFAVAAAARALLSIPGSAVDGPLARALHKLEVALGEDRTRVEVALSAHALALSRACGSHQLVELDYLGAFRGGETTRIVEPQAIVTREGRLYLDAWCRLANGWRRFRLERIRSLRLLEEHFEPRPAPGDLTSGASAFIGGGQTILAKIALPAGREALLERFAAGPAEVDATGRVVVPVAVADRRFLGRLLLRLGEGAEVVEPFELNEARREVAAAALARYRSHNASEPGEHQGHRGTTSGR
jgi:proteasome accessory factor C